MGVVRGPLPAEGRGVSTEVRGGFTWEGGEAGTQHTLTCAGMALGGPPPSAESEGRLVAEAAPTLGFVFWLVAGEGTCELVRICSR